MDTKSDLVESFSSSRSMRTTLDEIKCLPLGVALGWSDRDSRLIVSEFKGNDGPIEASGKVRIGDSLVSVNETDLTKFERSSQTLRTLRETPMPWTLQFESKRVETKTTSSPQQRERRKTRKATKRRYTNTARRRSTRTRKKKDRQARVAPPPPHVPEKPCSEKDILGRVYHALDRMFSPIHINVRNISYWHTNRARLGHAKFTFRGTSQRPVSRRKGPSEKYDASIYVDLKNERTNKYIVEKHFVGAFPTEQEALQAADIAASRRDIEISLRTPLDRRLQTHYHIFLVSDVFSNLSLTSRYAAVFDVLMNELWDSRRAAFTHGTNPTRWKKYGTVSKHVCDLPEYRYFLRNFVLNLKSPEEYSTTNKHITKTTETTSKELYTLLTHRDMLQQFNNAVLKEDSEDLAARTHHWASTAKKGDDPKKVRAHFVKCQLRLCTATISLQRIYLRHLSRRMHREYLKRHRAATNLSRFYRGYLGRMFTLAYRNIRTESTLVIQSFRRGTFFFIILVFFVSLLNFQQHKHQACSDVGVQSSIVNF